MEKKHLQSNIFLYFGLLPNFSLFRRVFIYERRDVLIHFSRKEVPFMSEYSISEIVDAIAGTLRGDTDAYGIIVRAYMNKLAVTARYYCGSDAYAEDLVQETFINGYLRLYTLREPEKIESWLTRILKNKALNYLTRTDFPESDEIFERLTDKNTPETAFIRADSRKELTDMLDTLSPALRETAKLYFLCQLSEADVAKRQGLPLGTVKRRIHDARILLKKEKERMKEKNFTLRDSFADELDLKIKQLADYTKNYPSPKGFDSAYSNVKKLISELSHKDDVRHYELESAEVATNIDRDRYTSDALAVYLKYGELNRASRLLHRNVIAWGEDLRTQINYTFDVVIPELEKYPESAEKHFRLAFHLMHLMSCFNYIDPKDAYEAEKYRLRALDELKKAGSTVNFVYPLAEVCGEGLKLIKNGNASDFLHVSSQLWELENGISCTDLYGRYLRSYSSVGRFSSRIYNDWGTFEKSFVPKKDGFPAGEGFTDGEEYKDVRRDGMIRRFTIISTSETVETPAGTFEGCLYFTENYYLENDIDETYHKYYKPGVGLVMHVCDNPCESKVLSSYEIVGGDGILPVAEGNVWRYVTLDAPDWLDETNEIRIVAVGNELSSGKKSAAVSILNRYSINKDAKKLSAEEIFSQADALSDEEKYAEALEKCKQIIILNENRDSVDAALWMIPHLEYRIEKQKLGWRFMPSRAGASIINKNDKGFYLDSGIADVTLGSFGTRHEENRIFGAKPWRYIQSFSDTLWDERWVPGYSEVYPFDKWDDASPRVTVEDGGTVKTPAGTFENTVKLTFECGDLDHESCYGYYFYNHTARGRKQFWVAPGVGIVRFRSDWGHHINTDTLLTAYNVIAEDGEMMPFHIGNYWRYEEMRLTEENYDAITEYKILSRTGDRITYGVAQTFAFKGTVDEYEAFKESLKRE